MPTLGMPQNVAWQGKTACTSVWKHHGPWPTGGEHRAVFVYQIDPYHYWQRQLDRDDFTYRAPDRPDRSAI
jgi:hypothetical protein